MGGAQLNFILFSHIQQNFLSVHLINEWLLKAKQSSASCCAALRGSDAHRIKIYIERQGQGVYDFHTWLCFKELNTENM